MIVTIMTKIKVLVYNDNSDRNYDGSYVLFTQAFLKLAFHDYE